MILPYTFMYLTILLFLLYPFLSVYVTTIPYEYFGFGLEFLMWKSGYFQLKTFTLVMGEKGGCKVILLNEN